MPTEHTEYTEGAGGKGGKGMPHAESAEDAEGAEGEGSGEGEEKFFTTNYTKDPKGGGRGPERGPRISRREAKGGNVNRRSGPRNTRNTRKNRSGGSEEWPEPGTGEGERLRERGTIFFGGGTVARLARKWQEGSR